MAEQQTFGDKEPFRGISLCSRLLLWWVRASVLLGLFCLEVTEQAGECLLVVVVLFPASEVSDVACMLKGLAPREVPFCLDACICRLKERNS